MLFPRSVAVMKDADTTTPPLVGKLIEARGIVVPSSAAHCWRAVSADRADVWALGDSLPHKQIRKTAKAIAAHACFFTSMVKPNATDRSAARSCSAPGRSAASHS